MISMLIDVTKCVGCERCVDACVENNNLGKHIPAIQHSDDGLSSTRWTSIVKKPKRRYVKKQCRHCLEPACVSACLVGAMQKTPEGPVIYDKSKCMGCRYCMIACPYGIPRYQWEKPVPYVQKCNLCYSCINGSKTPACVESCPEKVITFGKRDALLMNAKQIIRKNSGRYIQKVYGENEIGGTSVLYISDIPLEFLGISDNLGTKPLPKLTWASLKKVPAEFLGMGALMSGIYWVIERREKLKNEHEQKQSASPQKQKNENNNSDHDNRENK